MNRIIPTYLFLWLLLFCVTALAEGNTFYVSESGDNDNEGSLMAPWRDIQYAIDHPEVTDGDTIMVMDGTYRENVDVDKELTIQSVNGRDSTTVRTLDTNDHVFEVTSDNVTIKGFRVHSATGNFKAGIYLGTGTDHCIISNNRGTGCYYGCYLYISASNMIEGNIFNDNTDHGLRLYNSSNNRLYSNVCSYNDKNGMHLNGGSNHNKIIDNQCTYNEYNGVAVSDSEYNQLRENLCESNHQSGIYLGLSSSYNTIMQNGCRYNTLYGINISDSSNNYIYFNEIRDNVDANVESSGSTNVWHPPKKIAYRFFGGNVKRGYLGNYYGDYGSADTNFDGINDTPYDLPGTEPDDTYALFRWLSWYRIVKPVLPNILLLF